MPEIPPKAVQAAAEAVSLHYAFCDAPRWQDCLSCARVVGWVERALKAAAPFIAEQARAELDGPAALSEEADGLREAAAHVVRDVADLAGPHTLTPEEHAEFRAALRELKEADPALRTCLVPGCIAQYDAIAALTGEQPARPEWSSRGWRIIRSGLPFSGGRICPAHVEIVTAHLPHRIQGEREWVQAECKCGGWTSPRLRWHGAVRGLWEEHLLDVLRALDADAVSEEQTGEGGRD